MAAHTTMDEVLKALDAVDFPAGKDDLLTAAQGANARDEVIKALQGIPAEQYGNRQDVAHSVRLDPDSDLHRTPGQKGEQARQGGKPGLSQHLRDAPKPPVDEELEQ
ncbi:DUF2795 domain-containing protein [Streptomyces sp. NBC_01696]|uniref:DUF2795 domain-containing protein n=1 Tax=Streptomyces sp. gb1(2016) TaxID=1828321 RepID=A0A652L9S6_9ACTN|nr:MULTISPECIES: DUF2795 domain-containing protein [unclassified Streptomyces]RPK35112.1 hypothetical protein EES40_32280 [Streptomyces sp. ADI93-02]TXS32822.1 DUF2795 domain-containing protein [Streptomyces sp. gb1(2016)]WSS80007.1 DUF2795 domain-containing protein [Streptomyces sp. NBC_01174]